MASSKKYFNKGFIILNKGERIAVINLLTIIVILLGFSIFRPVMHLTKEERRAFHNLDSLLAIQEAAVEKQRHRAEIETKLDAPSQTNKKEDYSSKKTTYMNATKRASPTKETAITMASTIPQKAIEPIELNSTDSIALIALPQIGEVMASRIQRYRDRLGGFVTTDQLYEIKGMDSTRFETIQPYILLNDRDINKINVNQDAFKSLLRHPYLEYEQVKAIVNHRERRGFIKDWAQLCSIIGDVNPLLERYVTY
ncbi:MAG: helix-hairpin-helix domain-containing protein [Bacteroidales bacterium]|nr:helix-hairpin-helix domain-containing protein [Bacteroidales bacterium]